MLLSIRTRLAGCTLGIFHLAIEEERKVVTPPVWWVDNEQAVSIAEDMGRQSSTTY